jgi:hypothetical protein
VWRLVRCAAIAARPLARHAPSSRRAASLPSPGGPHGVAKRGRGGRGAGLSRWRARVWCALSSRRSSVIPCAPRGRTSPFFRRAPAPRPRRHGRHPAPRVTVPCTRRVGSPRRARSREPSRSAFARWALLPPSHHFLSAPCARCEPPSPAARRRRVVATREARGAPHRPNFQRLGRSPSAVRSRVRGAWRWCSRHGKPASAARGGGSLVATSLEVGRSIVVSSTARASMGPKNPCFQAKETAHRARRDAASLSFSSSSSPSSLRCRFRRRRLRVPCRLLYLSWFPSPYSSKCPPVVGVAPVVVVFVVVVLFVAPVVVVLSGSSSSRRYSRHRFRLVRRPLRWSRHRCQHDLSSPRSARASAARPRSRST